MLRMDMIFNVNVICLTRTP